MERFEQLKSQEEIDWEENRNSIRMWGWFFFITVVFYLLMFAALIKYLIS
ncbi:hypothetical protein PP753_gp18 [Dinoroseobacter phage vB_DshP-R7L]|uniref:Uncharacterized protein n=1 Tax=Dinoroseobacter phage vB_DshP-R7L TaxID=2873349 RepID=A0AAE8XD33_9CAUD|nr:hypothetical protein PP753_gp18 [Dinoroseobacter phage vB_DshP-R7L]UAT28857.1 hypothetical protein R7L_gp18 [Dinoroseobacter phage vB_DshP-R7L]